MTAALRPPEKWERLRWHWIDTPTGKEPWMWICDGWLPAGCRMPSDMTAYVGCKYSHPCDPTAIVPDPALAEPEATLILATFADGHIGTIGTGHEGGIVTTANAGQIILELQDQITESKCSPPGRRGVSEAFQPPEQITDADPQKTGFGPDAVERRDQMAVRLLRAFAGVPPEQAPSGWRIHPNNSTKAAWQRVAGVIDEELTAARAEVERLRAENTDLKQSVIAFCGPWAVEYARERGLPPNHLHPTHYDLLKKYGAPMDDFVRGDET